MKERILEEAVRSVLQWHCELVLSNNPDYAEAIGCLTTHVMSRVYHDHHGRAFEDQNRMRIYILAQFLRAYIEEQVDAGNEYRGYNQMTEELICGALQEIDFREIAEDLIGDYSPKSAEAVAEDEEFFNIMGFDNYDIDED